jgi:predicted RNase H-like nuclease (RuvC/YqgF family)
MMALTQSQRNQIASYKIQIESYRKDLERYKIEKKRVSEQFASMIKNTSDSNNKRNYRQTKIAKINSIDNQIEAKKREIDRVKAYIKSIKG